MGEIEPIRVPRFARYELCRGSKLLCRQTGVPSCLEIHLAPAPQTPVSVHRIFI